MTPIRITSQYGLLSRGRHSARRGKNKEVVWADKNEAGHIVIDSPGVWYLHCSDGFSRSARASLKITKNGDWTMTGDTCQFEVLDEPEKGCYA